MTRDLAEAATIAAVGVTVVMAALAALMVAIMLITRLAPGGKQTRSRAGTRDLVDETLERQGIAAMAVALAMVLDVEKKSGAAPPAGPAAVRPVASPWASAGREQLMRARGSGPTRGRSA